MGCHQLRYWKNEDDHDRQRRKQAECLIYQCICPEHIRRVVVFDEQQAAVVAGLLRKTGHGAELLVNPEKFYFHE